MDVKPKQKSKGTKEDFSADFYNLVSKILTFVDSADRKKDNKTKKKGDIK